MAGKRIFSLLLSLVLVFVLAYSCLAQSIRPFYNGSGNVRAIINNSSYSVKAETVSSVTKITVSGTLYEKGLFGIYGKVDSCSSSSSNQYCTARSSYSLKSGKPTGWTILQLFIIPMELTKPYRIHSTKTLNDV